MINERVLTGKAAYDHTLDAVAVMDACQDFVNETTLLEEIFRAHGHILVFSVKCHPELAGCGIEYSWGKMKLDLRRQNSAGLHALSVSKGGKSIAEIVRSQIPLSLSPERIWKYERKAREYRLMYVDLYEKIAAGTISEDDVTYSQLERMQKEQKSHRTMVELDKIYLESV